VYHRQQRDGADGGTPYYILYGDGGDEGRRAAYQSDTGRMLNARQRLIG